jgi:hypothetical protein
MAGDFVHLREEGFSSPVNAGIERIAHVTPFGLSLSKAKSCTARFDRLTANGIIL